MKKKCDFCVTFCNSTYGVMLLFCKEKKTLLQALRYKNLPMVKVYPFSLKHNTKKAKKFFKTSHKHGKTVKRSEFIDK